MKNSSIISAILGSAFFAVPYLGLSLGTIPSLAIGVTAFGASELIFHKSQKEINGEEKNLYEKLTEAKETNGKIEKMIPKIESKELVNTIKQINETVTKIINTVEKKPEKYKVMSNFFNYYLPVTLNILTRYDEIENQRLTTQDSQKFMKSAEDMIKNINEAFKKQLSNLYQSDMIDTDAEMKVFYSMLKSDGYDTKTDFEIKKGGKEN